MNIAVDNWIAGPDNTAYDVISEYTEIVNDQTVMVCPEETPFVVKGTDNCFKCNDATPIFEYSTNECVSCPSGMILIGHICRCPPGQYYDEDSEFCVVEVVWERPDEV